MDEDKDLHQKNISLVLGFSDFLKAAPETNKNYIYMEIK